MILNNNSLIPITASKYKSNYNKKMPLIDYQIKSIHDYNNEYKKLYNKKSPFKEEKNIIEIINYTNKDRKLKQNDIKKNIFNKLDNTNYGIMYYNNVKKGGAISDELENIQLFTSHIDDIAEYNTKIININNCNPKEISRFCQNFDKDIFYNIDNYYIGLSVITQEINDRSEDIMKLNLQTKIKSSYKYKNNVKYIDYDIDNKYKIKDLIIAPRLVEPTNYPLNFSHSSYNEDIITAYEKNYINNFNELKKYIDKQNEYIKNEMKLFERIIINDYTKYSCFVFYRSYANSFSLVDPTYARDVDGHWIDINYDIPNKFCFGDSLYKQILDIIGIHRFRHALRNLDTDYINKIYTNGINDIFDNINEYWNLIYANGLDRKDPESESIFADILNNKEWHYVMIKFIADINNIIMNAPKTETPLYCYRGVKHDYVDIATSDIHTEYSDITEGHLTIPKDTYTSVRIGSFSINFDSSKRYIDGGNMYRVVILPDVPLLYGTSLSYASHEFEMLHAGYAEFTNKGPKTECYNNKNNKWGILSNNTDKFKNIDITLNGYNSKLDPYFNIDQIQRDIDIYRVQRPPVELQHARLTRTNSGRRLNGGK